MASSAGGTSIRSLGSSSVQSARGRKARPAVRDEGARVSQTFPNGAIYRAGVVLLLMLFGSSLPNLNSGAAFNASLVARTNA
jgi:hypothetical protein